jgi:Tfp pilus assembly protein PilV
MLNILEFNNLESVEFNYRQLQYEESQKGRKPLESRFPPVLPKGRLFNTNYLSEIEPVTKSYADSTHNIPRLSLSPPNKVERQETAEDSEESSEQQQKAWLWGKPVLLSQANEYLEETRSLEKLQQDSTISESNQTGSVIFWGNLASSQDGEVEMQGESEELKDDQDGDLQATSLLSNNDLESDSIDWLSIDFPRYCAGKYAQNKFNYNLTIGKLLMDSCTQMKSLLPDLEVDYRVANSQRDEEMIENYVSSVDAACAALAEAKDIDEILVPEETEKFKQLALDQRTGIAQDIVFLVHFTASKEAYYHERYLHEKRRVEHQILSENEFIQRTRNFVLLQKLLDDHEGLQLIKSNASRDLEILGNYLKRFYEIESEITNRLR